MILCVIMCAGRNKEWVEKVNKERESGARGRKGEMEEKEGKRGGETEGGRGGVNKDGEGTLRLYLKPRLDHEVVWAGGKKVQVVRAR
jgi:hypothetical protein